MKLTPPLEATRSAWLPTDGTAPHQQLLIFGQVSSVFVELALKSTCEIAFVYRVSLMRYAATQRSLQVCTPIASIVRAELPVLRLNVDVCVTWSPKVGQRFHVVLI